MSIISLPVVKVKKMKTIEIYKNRSKPVISFEFFPPRNGESLDGIYSTFDRLKKFKPAFITVTGGALGSQRGGTIAIVGSLKRKYKIEGVVHLTCANKSKQDLENMLMEIKYNDIENVLALRGDPPRDSRKFIPHPQGYGYAYELVAHIKGMNEGKYFGDKEGTFFEGLPAGFCVSVAGYPEGHPECNPSGNCFDYLKMKVDAGADYIMTQMFFDAEKFLEFRERAVKIGVNVPIIPGIMPVQRYNQVNFLLRQMGISIPNDFRKKLDANQKDADAVKKVCFEHDLSMVKELIAAEVPGLHFFTMNHPEATEKLLNEIK